MQLFRRYTPMCNGLPTGIKFKGENIMNYTSKHHLPQWSKSDRILMDDFNAAMANLENSLNANAQTANAAKSTASSAYSAAQTALSGKPYATGTYTGTGANLTINVGFRPSFVFITSMKAVRMSDLVPLFGVYSCATTGNGDIGQCIQMTANGFTVYGDSLLPKLSDSGRFYEYFAFK